MVCNDQGCHLVPQGQGFSPATTKNEPKEIPSCLTLSTRLLVVFTQQLEISVTTLNDCLITIILLFFCKPELIIVSLPFVTQE